MQVKSEAWYKGYESKSLEITEMGWEAARDKFNAEYPTGEKWKGSHDGLSYAKGEFRALEEKR